ncbi:Phage protein [Weissella jogaejeotgali]|uniref:Phage protein n=1 Tax=Weissella jogaejeotgali TaxID=1631871 RepID=A0A1L6RB07_9LACO|nr:DUF3862 domain-containing protein [Weissella jogaejeotgali]APS41703.1 Phage protein [Weissella jogaejeotgali]
MKKKIITVVAGILAIILIVVVSEHSQNTTSHHDSNVSASKWTKKSFDKLKIGDFNKNGQGGASYEEVIAKYGRPDKKSKSKTNGYTITVVSWKNIAGDYTGVTLTFLSQKDTTKTAKLTSKTILDSKTINLAKKWTMSNYNAITLEDKDSNEHDGDSLDSLTNKYGKPASLTLARINGKVQTNAVWHNTNGGANGTVSVDFSEQNTATDKKQEKLR